MYLLCLNSTWMDQFGQTLPGPDFMETVFAFMARERDGVVFYYLNEYNPMQGFRADEFLPLSNKDEVEILEQRKKRTK